MICERLSSREEYEYTQHLQREFPDINHAWNTKSKLPRFCNSIPDAISYQAKTLFYYHGVSEWTLKFED